MAKNLMYPNDMPRKSRIDAPGALHHVMARGINRASIFKNDSDRIEFLKRLADILSETETVCYAWALLPNHFHLLLRTADFSISTVFRRLLTGYALWFNKTHDRSGHLFQNRFKSILCQEEPYFMQLVRYIHLNPLRAGLVEDLVALDRYPFSGHSAVMGTQAREWQAVEEVLKRFGDKAAQSRKAYKSFVEAGVKEGRREDLVGGGLIRSLGGWEAVMERQRSKIFQMSDERILGDGDFVASVLARGNESLARKYRVRSSGLTVDNIGQRVAELLGMTVEEIWAPGRSRRTVKARSLLCYWAVRELGKSMTAMARRLDLSVPVIGRAVKRGESLAREMGYRLTAR